MLMLEQSAELQHRFDAAALARFGALCGGASGVHVPEPLIAALFSQLLGMRLPGAGTNYLKQELRFHTRARADEPLRASVEITRLRPEKRLVDLRTLCLGNDGRLICDGRALVKATLWTDQPDVRA